MSYEENFDQDIAESVDHGVMYDKLNLRSIGAWSIAGVILLVMAMYGVSEFYHYNKFQLQKSQAAETVFHDYENIKKAAQEKLGSAGVVDAEAGVYRIPIEDAIKLYLNEAGK